MSDAYNPEVKIELNLSYSDEDVQGEALHYFTYFWALRRLIISGEKIKQGIKITEKLFEKAQILFFTNFEIHYALVKNLCDETNIGIPCSDSDKAQIISFIEDVLRPQLTRKPLVFEGVDLDVLDLGVGMAAVEKPLLVGAGSSVSSATVSGVSSDGSDADENLLLASLNFYNPYKEKKGRPGFPPRWRRKTFLGFTKCFSYEMSVHVLNLLKKEVFDSETKKYLLLTHLIDETVQSAAAQYGRCMNEVRIFLSTAEGNLKEVGESLRSLKTLGVLLFMDAWNIHQAFLQDLIQQSFLGSDSTAVFVNAVKRDLREMLTPPKLATFLECYNPDCFIADDVGSVSSEELSSDNEIDVDSIKISLKLACEKKKIVGRRLM